MTDFINIQSLKISQLNQELKGEGTEGEKICSFRYVNIGDTVFFTTRGKGKRKYYKVERIKRDSEFFHNCKVFSECGGCAGQHIQYEEQFKLKTSNLYNKFTNEFGLNIELIPAVKNYHYRNRMDFTIHPGLTGLHQVENFRKIIDVKKCYIQSEEANEELIVFRNWLKEHPLLPYNRKTEEGYLKYITIRKGKNLVSILTFIDDFFSNNQMTEIEESYTKVSLADNIIFCFNRKKSEISADGKFKVIKGNEFFQQKINDKNIFVPFNSFFQPNTDEFENIINFIKSKIFSIPNYSQLGLIDLFCGSGFFSLLLGDLFQSVTGFDSVPSSIESAKISFSKLFNNKKGNFAVADLFQEKIFKEILKDLNHSILIVDPPRAGLGVKLSEFIKEYGSEYLFYVSCNPWNQLNDLHILKEKYEIIDGLICDPYPQTPHLESVIYLKRK